MCMFRDMWHEDVVSKLIYWTGKVMIFMKDDGARSVFV